MRALLLLTLASVVLGGCSLFGDDEGYSGPDDYAYTLHVGCFCVVTGPLHITVRDGEVTDVELLEPSEDAPPPSEEEIAERALTLVELSDLAARARREADDVDVRYDPTYGHPIELSIDWRSNATDDEFTYTASDYEPL